MTLSRRSFLTGLLSTAAVVKLPVAGLDQFYITEYVPYIGEPTKLEVLYGWINIRHNFINDAGKLIVEHIDLKDILIDHS